MHKLFTMMIAVIVIMFCVVNHVVSQSNRKPMKNGNVERINYEKLDAPGGPFSHAVRHGNVLYVSGMTAYGTEAQGKSMAEQAKEIWKKNQDYRRGGRHRFEFPDQGDDVHYRFHPGTAASGRIHPPV